VREPANRYEWPCPGDLLHMDTSAYARFQRPGHRLTGDRTSQDRQHRDGVDIVHAIIDDHSRLAYAEIHSDERAATVVAFLERALAFYNGHGISPKRLMTDNAWAYTRSRELQRLLDRHQLRHLTTKPYRPRTNGCESQGRFRLGPLPGSCRCCSCVTRPNGWLVSMPLL
jgi:transposase InsO family protein